MSGITDPIKNRDLYRYVTAEGCHVEHERDLDLGTESIQLSAARSATLLFPPEHVVAASGLAAGSQLREGST